MADITVQIQLTRIEGKVDELLAARADHETRLRATERKQWLHTGGVAALAFFLTKFGFPHS